MFKNYREPVISRDQFVRRFFRSFGMPAALTILSLLLGTIGCRFTEGTSWIEAYYDASLIMSGMGPVDSLQTNAGRIFASLYSLYSGLFLVAATGLLLMPLFHRMPHALHVELES